MFSSTQNNIIDMTKCMIFYMVNKFNYENINV